MTSYGYDAVSRLSSLSHDLAGTAGDLTLSFSYNPASQIVSSTRSNDAYAWTGHGSGTTSSTANGLNQLTGAGGTGIAYDARGNMTSDGSLTFGYSSENLLTSVGGATRYPGGAVMTYDPLMRLYSEVSWISPRHVHDGMEAIAQYGPSGNLIARHVFGPGNDEPLLILYGANQRRYNLADERGSIIASTDEAGSLASWDGVVPPINSYDEYGFSPAEADTLHQYTGQMWLPPIADGIYNYKNRIYHSRLGRFLQADPIGYGDGMNIYGYVGGDPVNLTDPTGLAEEGQTLYVNGTRSYYGMSPGTGPIGQGSGTVFGNDSRFISGESLPNDDTDGDGHPDPDIVVIAKRPTPQKIDNKIIVAAKKATQCAFDHFGISDLLDAGTAALGIPQKDSKRFVTRGSSRGTSALSKGLAQRFPQKVGDTRIGQALGLKRIWTPRLGQLNRATPVVGRAIGHLIPLAGAALLAADAVEIGACTFSD